MRRVTGWIGLLSVLVVVAGVAGCLKFPLGDPERSRVDTTLTGLWLLKDAEPSENQLVVITPYDGRTSLVRVLVFARDEKGIAPASQAVYRMWMTEVKGVRFATLEAKEPMESLEKTEEPYGVLRLAQPQPDQVEIKIINPNFVSERNVNSAADLEKLIAANVDEPELYGTPATFARLGADRVDEVRSILRAFYLEK